MRCKATLARGMVLLGFAISTYGGEVQRIGHTNLAPRHTAPDDKGMYAAAIDPTNGYAYFMGSWMVKLDITGNLPAQVGPALLTGQSSSIAIDLAGGFLYQSLGTGLTKFALGNGASAMTNEGSLSLAAGSSQGVVVDDSDPNPANHNLYAVCVVSGNPARVAKVALSTFTELGFVSLGVGETNSTLGHTVDARKGYAYFVMGGIPNTTTGPRVVKIKMTPGASAPVLIGALNLDVTGTLFLDGGSIDTVHGYAYYGTYDSDTNIPGHVYKVKLEDGDVPPSLVGRIDLRAGEGRLAASFCDPANGFVYFADDNTYPGHLYQLAMNGTNLPIEIGRTPMQGTTNVPPPDGVTSTNNTVNSDGVLPFGEVYFRSAVFDSVRGYAYLGQDSRPNQVVKVQPAKVDPFTLNNPHVLPNGSFQFSFTNIMGAAFSTLASTNVSVVFSNWPALGGVTETAPGQYQFTDPQPANQPQRFYRVGQSP